MPRTFLNGARAVLLAGPAALAFCSGGYFDQPRLWAGLVAWLLVAVGALAAPRPLPRGRPARLALASLGLLAAWTLLSISWAPLAGPAYHDAQRVVLYAGTLLAASTLLGARAPLRAVEPALAAGATVVVAYGLSERLLPWALTLSHSASAQGRLEQPLTYWNAMGALAAVGVVLSARLAGDQGRCPRLRAAAAAAGPLLGLGLFLSFSRGALFACLAGLVALLVAAPTRAQARGAAVVVAGGVLTAACATPFRAVTELGAPASADVQGAVVLGVVGLAGAVAAALTLGAATAGAADPGLASPVPLPRRAPVIALGLVALAFVLFLVVGAREHGGRAPLSPGATRYTTLQSNRYQYWRVALEAFAGAPIAGEGSASFGPRWLRSRPFAEGALDAHSLYIETAAELGLIGLVLLGGLVAGVVQAGRVAHRLAPTLAAGPIAGITVWAAHAAVDWDWEMPAVTLPALILAGALLALGELGVPPRRARRRPA